MIIIVESEVHGEKRVLIDMEDLSKLLGTSLSVSGDGKYVMIHNNSKREYLHREICGAIVGQVVDHININTFDNRKANLRVTDKAGNEFNKVKRSTKCTSIYKGVIFNKSRNKWDARIKNKYIGRFTTELEAAIAYNNVAKNIDGCRLNEITNELTTISNKCHKQD